VGTCWCRLRLWGRTEVWVFDRGKLIESSDPLAAKP
jgi:hypothetical protein